MADAFAYNSAGQVTGFRYNNDATFTAAFGYSADRLQLTSLTYTKSSQKLLELTYAYGASGSNNGQITGITDTSDQTLTPGAAGRSVTYTYDALHRLKTAVTTGSTQYPQWGLEWIYDRYGNRDEQKVTARTAPPHNPAIDPATNRIVEDANHTYDQNGNMTKDGVNTLAYDAANRVISAAGATYTYDGGPLRVKKVSGATTTVYVFSGTKVIAEYENGAAVGSPTREYIYSGSQLLAKIEGGVTTYSHPDHLSPRVMTNTSGGTITHSGHYPFGENWYETASNKLKFTSYDRDIASGESGIDYAIFRSHIPRLGRFSAPDPLAGSIGNPQSLNRYAYTANDSINFVDPLGLTMISHCVTGYEAACQDSGSENPVYYVDGRQVDAKTAQAMARAGAASGCPRNQCHGWDYTQEGFVRTTLTWAWLPVSWSMVGGGIAKTPVWGTSGGVEGPILYGTSIAQVNYAWVLVAVSQSTLEGGSHNDWTREDANAPWYPPSLPSRVAESAKARNPKVVKPNAPPFKIKVQPPRKPPGLIRTWLGILMELGGEGLSFLGTTRGVFPFVILPEDRPGSVPRNDGGT